MAAPRHPHIADRLWTLLISRHHGADRSASVSTLLHEYEGAYGETLSDRNCRAAIALLVTERGKPVCSFPEGGFFVATTIDELEHACAHLESRAVACLDRAKALRRTQPLPPPAPHFRQPDLFNI